MWMTEFSVPHMFWVCVSLGFFNSVETALNRIWAMLAQAWFAGSLVAGQVKISRRAAMVSALVWGQCCG
jgi:hypothetical protein